MQRRSFRTGAAAAVLAATLGLAACESVDRTTGDRALTGAAVGAAGGAAVGLLSGNPIGNAVRGAVGGAAGGFVYDQIQKTR